MRKTVLLFTKNGHTTLEKFALRYKNKIILELSFSYVHKLITNP